MFVHQTGVSNYQPNLILPFQTTQPVIPNLIRNPENHTHRLPVLAGIHPSLDGDFTERIGAN